LQEVRTTPDMPVAASEQARALSDPGFESNGSALLLQTPQTATTIAQLGFDQVTSLDSVVVRARGSGLPGCSSARRARHSAWDDCYDARRGHTHRPRPKHSHRVAGELSKRGWIATITSKNTPGVDILANQDDRFSRIDVKTRTSGLRSG
jgi:hypothetical protein